MEEYSVKPIGYIRSTLKDLDAAPKFYTESGAPHARLELIAAYTDGLDRVSANQDIIVITWLHLAQRDVLKVHPQGNLAKPLTGVFLTRSPDRPNPLGLHRAKVLAVEGHNLLIGPIEVIDGTPVLDLKPVVEEAQDF
ncbi:S-adenosyl-L-methionine-binding protein [Thermoflexales bacterium]|nr:S-adenosyl-L-methionine-binding protein [Thermoflexales bacterium]